MSKSQAELSCKTPKYNTLWKRNLFFLNAFRQHEPLRYNYRFIFGKWFTSVINGANIYLSGNLMDAVT